ncbi:sensor histidine kinase [Roseovarius amoyensis]|uniref:sensor histidine kinase n=1 Tax=Roseovarius amoyensis TaxID=2211448 RepID=UPI000DBE4DDE|nr:sensor histidine kinase [Roseovarius amoyensis]
MSDRPPPRARRPSKPGLALRLVFVLTIAILPLGLISVYQTHKVLQERQSLSEVALLQRTQTAVQKSREVIRSIIATAETLAIQISAIEYDETTCDAIMQQVVERSGLFVFAGYRDNELGLVCSSINPGPDGEKPLSDLPELDSNPDQFVLSPLEFLGGIATVSVTVPVFEDADFRGTVWISVPISVLNDALSGIRDDVDLVLFRSGGEIVATEEFAEDRRSILPQDKTLMELAAEGQQSFRGTSRAGQVRDFAVSPVVDGRIYGLGSWKPRPDGVRLPLYEGIAVPYFPIAIWAVTILVAYMGMHRLVIRHVRRLRSWMRLYASGRTDLQDARFDNAPEELEIVAEAFRAMTRRLSEQDRERQEDLSEKTVLLREVHHRVKNNLQLISSMINMQIRATESPEAKRLLRRVQDRVMALSAIHRYLYLARKLSMLRADTLLEEIIQHVVVAGTLEETGQTIKVSTQLDPVEINPDQSVPLSLLTTEAVMNAVKYSGVAAGGEAWINIALKSVGDGQLCLSVVNSVASAGDSAHEEHADGSGLGSRLIRSFVTQLNGTLETRELPNRYELHAVFSLAWHQDDAEND